MSKIRFEILSVGIAVLLYGGAAAAQSASLPAAAPVPPDGRAGHRCNLADPAHLGAKVMGLQVDGDAVRLEHGLQGICNLLADSLLNRKSFAKQTHEARQL